MPIGPYPDFASCVESMMSKQGHDEESAKKICGAMEKSMALEHVDDEDEMVKKQMAEKEVGPIRLTMPKGRRYYEILDNGESLTIAHVPIMQMGTDVKGIKVDKQFFEHAIAIHQQLKEDNGFLPSVFIGHNDEMTEKPAVGFFDNLTIEGKTLYADLVQLDRDVKLKAFPNRSVEVFNGRITGLALLGSTAPFFKLAPVFKEQAGIEIFYPLTKFSMSQDETVVVKDDPEKVEAKGSESITLAEHNRRMTEEMNNIKAQLDQATDKLRERELQEKVQTYVEANKVLPKSKVGMVSFLKGISHQNAEKFFEILEGMPKLSLLASEIGASGEGEETVVPEGVDPESAKLDSEVKKLSEAKGISYAEAYDLLAKSKK